MGLLKEFKDFAMRGNVVDLAVGVVIGSAFGKIISSAVGDIIMPPLNLITAKSGLTFNSLSLKYSDIFRSQISLPLVEDGKEVLKDGAQVMVMTNPDLLKYGPFMQATLDFAIVAFALFLVIKAMNALKKKQDAAPVEPAATPEDVLLLREIRDSLSKTAPRRAE